MNALTYAYIGDCIYEFFVRKYLISLGYTKPIDLQKKSINYVSAKSQRRILEKLISEEFLTSEELEMVRYGRNSKGTSSKSCDIITYRYATGFECLIGYLYYQNKLERIEEIMQMVVSS